jgi:RimJ/RimL family protein N-acetyltransferase
MLPVGEPVEPLPSGRAPEHAPLQGRYVKLEPLDAARHAASLFACSHARAEDATLWTYMAYGPFADRHAMHAWLQTCAAAEDPLFFTVVERDTGRRVGMCSFMSVVPEMKRIEIGHIWYAPHLQGSGISVEVAWMLLMEAFERLGYRRVEWKCNALNERSRRAALKLGFTFEGVFRQHMIVKGRNRDSAWFAMTDRDWPAARADLESRMKPR